MILCIGIRIATETPLEAPDSAFLEEDTVVLILSTGRKAKVRFSESGAKVIRCDRFDRKERMEISSYINEEWMRRDIPHRRSAQSLLAELSFHTYSYRMGIEREKSIDADLEYESDPRWYVNIAVAFFETMGL